MAKAFLADSIFARFLPVLKTFFFFYFTSEIHEELGKKIDKQFQFTHRWNTLFSGISSERKLASKITIAYSGK